MIKIFLLNRGFQLGNQFSQEYLKSKGIVFTEKLLEADVLISNTFGLFRYKLVKILFFFKKFIIWTNEPRWDSTFQNFKSRSKIIMNVYSGDVFFHNLHFLGSYHNIFSCNLGVDLQKPPGIPLTSQILKEKKKFCIAVFGYRNPTKSQLIINGSNADLYAQRQNLALFFNKLGKMDIVGNNWPESVNILERSGFENGNNSWWNRKIDLLKDYKFNLCYENTICPYYCTEKIWHAILGGCLPIYYGEGTAIYETFPQNSFIDASQFKSHEDLLQFLEMISIEEHIKRYNMCLKVLHESCIKRIENPNLKTDSIDKFISNVYQLVKR